MGSVDTIRSRKLAGTKDRCTQVKVTVVAVSVCGQCRGSKGVTVKNAVLSTPVLKTIGTIQDSSSYTSNEGFRMSGEERKWSW